MYDKLLEIRMSGMVLEYRMAIDVPGEKGYNSRQYGA